MKTLWFVSLLATTTTMACAQYSHPPIPVSGHDRVYSADQTSNTVSVIDPESNRILGVLSMGAPIPKSLSPLYTGQLLVHGMGYSPDSKTLIVVSVGSNSVTFIDTMTNAVKGVLYVGRSPHEAFFTPDGRQVWTTVRGEDYISVADAVTMKEVRRITVANGPGEVMFSPDGKYGFCVSSFTTELDVINVKTYGVIKRLKQASPFSPNLAVSPDGLEFWITLKDSATTQAFSAKPPFNLIATLDTGPITDHVNFVDNKLGSFAYVTVGGLNEVKVFRRGKPPTLVATIPVGELPHGIWPSGDGTRVYVALENAGAVEAIDTITNKVIADIPAGQTSQALVYIPNAVPSGDGTQNLVPLGGGQETIKIHMTAPAGAPLDKASASVGVEPQGVIDLVEVAAVGLKPLTDYQLVLVDSPEPPFRKKEVLGLFTTLIDGAQIVQATSLLKPVISVDMPMEDNVRRYFMVSAVSSPDVPVLLEQPIEKKSPLH